jgi:predicted transcriptional regulator
VSQAKLRRKKRSRLEIMHDILDQCQTGSKKTWVMYRANLSYDLTDGYLEELTKLGLVENRDGLYYTTEKGKQLNELLKAWRQKKSELDDITKMIKEILPEDGWKERKAKEAQPAPVPAPAQSQEVNNTEVPNRVGNQIEPAPQPQQAQPPTS